MALALYHVAFFTVVPPGPITLPDTADGTLTYLSRVFATGATPRVVARSYDAHSWETLLPDVLSVACHEQSGVCSGNIPDHGDGSSYRLTTISTQTPLPAKKNAARFLMQTTFGGTPASVSQLAAAIEATTPAAAFEQWMAAQLGMPPTLLRSHFRQHANPRLTAPLSTGGVRRACEVGSRWHRYAFTKDDVGKFMTISQLATDRFQLIIDSIVRTEVAAVGLSSSSGPLFICSVDERAGVGGPIMVGASSDSARRRLMAFNPLGAADDCTETLPNPIISFASAAPPTGTFSLPSSPGLRLIGLAGVDDARTMECDASPCASDAIAALPPCTATLVHAPDDNSYWRFDARLELVENTVAAPAAGGTSQLTFKAGCANVAKTIFTRGHCVLRDTCAPTLFTSAHFLLNSSVLTEFYRRSSKYVYAIEGLRLEDAYEVSPCDDSAAARWERQAGACSSETALDSETRATLAAAIRATSDANPYVRDVLIAGGGGGTCHANKDGVSSVGASLTVDGACFTHVHPQHLDVLDFSYWASQHEGNKLAEQNGRRNPITGPAELGAASITFPSHHLMKQFQRNADLLAKLGRLGDTVDFASLPTSTQASEIAELVGALGKASFGAAEACGSPGEAANEPGLPHTFGLYMTEYQNGFSELYRKYNTGGGSAKHMAWASVVTRADDQLRHRAAWALSQVLVLSHEGVQTHRLTEVYLHYYDIMVRHAFGTYKDLLREISYSPAMAKYLTYLGNKGFVASGTYPDENFAREIMQLFSIGLILLNRDGTPVLDAAGAHIQTYTNDDIMDFSRAWTGFDLQPPRGNIEHHAGDNADNIIDPMVIKPGWRDPFPKMNLFSTYIGDGYPLCVDLPSRGFLRRGARFRLIGYADTPVWTKQPGTVMQTPGRFALDPASSLYAALANVTSADAVLNASLPCFGAECRVETLDVINVTLADGATVYYEYIEQPCVGLAFFDHGKVVHETMGEGEQLCADPQTLSGGVSCCSGYEETGRGMCEYFGETNAFESAKVRCDAASRPGAHLAMCEHKINWHSTCGFSAIFTWLDAPCDVRVQVHPTGWVNLVHTPTSVSHFDVGNRNHFRVRWDKGQYPTPAGGCGGCTTHGDACICNVTAVMTPVFTDAAQVPLQASDIDLALPIGSASPDTFDEGAYVKCTSGWCAALAGAEVWLSASSGVLDADTIFKVTRNGTSAVHLRNKVSTVHVGSFGTAGSGSGAPWAFRNAPHFMSFLPTHKSVRDAEYETEATLDHYVTHPTTPPFLAYRLIQRLTASNPSPRYIKAVADAFATGTYAPATSLSFSGRYGDLIAMLTAILLDREARSASLEADPTHGGLREPVLKLLHVLRAMEYQQFTHGELELWSVQSRIGQYAFESPSVFNFVDIPAEVQTLR